MVHAPWDGLLEGEELAYLTTEPARAARSAPFPGDLDPRVASALVAQEITSLYPTGRAWGGRPGRARDRRRDGERQSLAFNLPCSTRWRRIEAPVLYLYPTKALAQDRPALAFRLQALRPATYDGDTGAERRWRIRKWSNAILTNPDMLHVGVLPHHDRWGDVLCNLRYVVVDEAHVYRGVFGSHVGNVLRRLRRLARAYGADPQFLLASATIANPGELAEAPLCLPATVIADDGAPSRSAPWRCGTRHRSTPSSGCGERARHESLAAMAGARHRGLRTICFARAGGRPSWSTASPSSASTAEQQRGFRPYRAGYAPAAARARAAARRASCWGLRDRRARAGIDIGSSTRRSRSASRHRRLAPAAVGTRRPPRARAGP